MQRRSDRTWLTGAALAFAAMALAGGCTTARPAVSVSGARVTETTPTATQLAIDLTLSNESREQLRLLEYDYEVSVDGAAWYSGRWSAQQTLQPGSTVTATIPAAGPAVSGETATVRGVLRYVLPGEIAEILLDTGVRRPKAGFRGEASLNEAG